MIIILKTLCFYIWGSLALGNSLPRCCGFQGNPDSLFLEFTYGSQRETPLSNLYCSVVSLTWTHQDGHYTTARFKTVGLFSYYPVVQEWNDAIIVNKDLKKIYLKKQSIVQQDKPRDRTQTLKTWSNFCEVWMSNEVDVSAEGTTSHSPWSATC